VTSARGLGEAQGARAAVVLKAQRSTGSLGALRRSRHPHGSGSRACAAAEAAESIVEKRAPRLSDPGAPWRDGCERTLGERNADLRGVVHGGLGVGDA
jgi:hypothetical protein